MKMRVALFIASLAVAGCSSAMALPNGFFALTDPRSINGCVSWLRSDLGVSTSGSNVTGWSSLVGSTSATGPSGVQPTYSASGGTKGRPKLTFSGSQCLSWALSLTGAKTVAMVVNLSSDPSSGSFYALYNVGNNVTPGSATVFSEHADMNNFSPGYLAQSIAFDLPTTGVGYSGLLSTSTTHYLIDAYNGSGSSTPSNFVLVQDSTSESVAASQPFGVTSNTGAIGCRLANPSTVTFGIVGDLYEVVVYNRQLSAGEIGMLQGYFRALYGI